MQLHDNETPITLTDFPLVYTSVNWRKIRSHTLFRKGKIKSTCLHYGAVMKPPRGEFCICIQYAISYVTCRQLHLWPYCRTIGSPKQFMCLRVCSVALESDVRTRQPMLSSLILHLRCSGGIKEQQCWNNQKTQQLFGDQKSSKHCIFLALSCLNLQI